MSRENLAALSVFATVAARRSFRAAARELELSPSAVSHAVSALEARLGTRLLARTTRSVAPTEAGQALLAQLAPALGEIDAALLRAAESGARPSGLVRITVPRSSVDHIFLPRAAAFAAAYPDITLELHGDDGLIDIVAEGYDAGLRFGESLEADMVAVRFGPRKQRMIVVAAPALLAERGTPRHPRDLVDFPCIGMRRASGQIYRWELEKEGEALDVAVTGPLILNDTRLIMQAVANGLGLGFVFEANAQAALASGTIVTVLDDWCPPFPGFFLYYPSRRQMRPALRAVIDFFAHSQ
jgi:DNA-binding transcriptional LysR family regulator